MLRLKENESTTTPLPDDRGQSFVVTGDGALAAGFAAALRQSGLSVHTGHASTAAAPGALAIELPGVGDGALLCHVAADDSGVCWSFSDGHGQAPVPHPLTAFRRAASLAAATAPGDDFGTPVSPITIAAQQIAHTMLGGARLHAGTVTFLDRRTLRTSTHNVTVHPYDVPADQRAHDEFRRGRADLHDAPPLDRQELTRRWQRLSDDRFGAFAGLDETKLRQLPLKVTLARMSDPCGLLSGPPAVAGVGIDTGSARERAMFQALAAYGSVVVDPRLLVDVGGRFLGPPDGDATRLLESVRAGSVDAFVRATDLTDGRDRLLPARQVFGVLRAPELAPSGTSAAPSWRQALTHGLLQHCVRLTISRSSFRTRQHAVLAAEDFDQDPGLRFLAAMVKAAGIGITLHDITGPAGVPVVACVPASGQTVYGGGAQLAEAVREALTAALFRYQLQCDAVLRTTLWANPASDIWTNPASSASLSPDRLVDALASLGYTPSVFALGHDRAVHEAFPYVLRVIITGPTSAVTSRAARAG
jgi:hypothetical protein